MELKVYADRMSQPSRAVIIFCKVNGIQFDEVLVILSKRQQLAPEFKGKPSTEPGTRFLEFLEEDEMAFDNLYCIAFQMIDAQWLAKRASEFNDVLKSTRAQLERELALEDVSSIKDSPAYNLLYK